jgi:hypothetical protein
MPLRLVKLVVPVRIVVPVRVRVAVPVRIALNAKNPFWLRKMVNG